MNDIDTLKRQVEKQQRELSALEQRMTSMREQLMSENKQQLELFRKNAAEGIKQHDKTTLEYFEKLLDDYQGRINSTVTQGLSQLNDEYRSLAEAVESKSRDLDRTVRELERTANSLRDDIAKKETISGELAYTYLQNSERMLGRIDRKPHEKFMPHRVDIFRSSISEAKKLIRWGLYNAGIAIAVSSRTGLERLGFSIDDKVSEWEAKYDLLCLKTEYMKARLQQVLKDWAVSIGTEESPNNEIERVEINHWSRGLYYEIESRMNEIARIVQMVERYGRERFLKIGKGLDLNELSELIDEIDRMRLQLDENGSKPFNRYKASCERADEAEILVNFFVDEINYTWDDMLTGYREVSKEEAKSEDYIDYMTKMHGDEYHPDDDRDWFRVVFEDKIGNRIHVYSVPIESGDFIINDVIIYIAFKHSEDSQLSSVILDQVCKALDIGDDENRRVSMINDINELRTSENIAVRELARGIEFTYLN